jgi:hypothetical protein
MKLNFMKTFLAFSFLLILPIQPAFSHSGRTDVNGCHTNRKTGEYHCHGKKIVPKVKKSGVQQKISPRPIPKSKSKELVERKKESKKPPHSPLTGG